MTAAEARIGVDIGGTFTDIALEIGSKITSIKLLTDYEAPERAILSGIERVCEQAGIALNDLSLILHGTTLATNALIERRGARTAFLTSEGFRDVIEIRTESRFDQYDLNLVVPPPLIPREDRFTVAGRIAASGRELVPLDEAGVAAFAKAASDAGYESIAVGFIHSYVNASHEQRTAEIIAEHAPHLTISTSSAVSPQMREFERFNTVCSNAFVKPLMASYLGRLVEKLKDAGANCPVFMMHSGGGLMSIETAAEFPVRLLESGPAGGAIFAADLALRHGEDRVLSFDMGGTTAKICLIEKGEPKTARTFEVARTTRFKKGSGMPISIPVIEMVEIGAGGGSLASVDAMRQIRVGPQSAGSEPGPACYGRGGNKPAVTDADLILGKLDPENFAGGDIPLYPEKSQVALQEHLAGILAIDTATAAAGVAEIVDETMANAARVHAVENGKALSDFTMIAFGGAAPLHAARLCEKLGMRRVLIPAGAGVGSAIGFLRAPFGYEAVRGAYARLSSLRPDWLNDVMQGLEDMAQSVVSQGVADGTPLEKERKAFMRYRGQGWEIAVVLPEGDFGEDAADALRALFTEEYKRLFGTPLAGLDIEVLNWSVRLTSPRENIDQLPRPEARDIAEAPRHRDVFDASAGGPIAAGIFERPELAKGEVVFGPAVIQERETTTILPRGFTATQLADGSLLLTRAERQEAAA